MRYHAVVDIIDGLIFFAKLFSKEASGKKIDWMMNQNRQQNIFLLVDICFIVKYVSSNMSRAANTCFNVNFCSLVFFVAQT